MIMINDDKRLTILSKAEIIELFEQPNFTEEERVFYFALDNNEYKIMRSFGSISSRMFFILQLGHFKAKQAFFILDLDSVQEDLSYIARTYFSNEPIPKTTIGQKARLNHQSYILNLCGCSKLDNKLKRMLQNKASELSRININLRMIFDELITFLEGKKIVFPKYSTLQDIIGEAITSELKRLGTIIQKNLPESVDEILRKMLVSEGKKLYGITILKRDAKGFNYKEVIQEIKKKQASDSLFKAAEQIIPKLEISEENVCHYAYLVDYYTVDRLNALPYKTVRLYLLCYIFYRFEKINDNLVSSFIYRTNIYKKEAKQDSKNKVYEHKTEDNHYGEKIGKILDLFTDQAIPDDIKFGDVRTKAFNVIEKQKFHLLKHHVTHQTFDEEEFRWEYYKKIAKTISRNLRPLVRAIDFEEEDPNHPLMEALTFLKTTFNNKKSLRHIDEDRLPKEFIPFSLKPYLYETEEKEGKPQKVLNVYQYEFLIYYLLERALNCGRVFINNSYNFKSLKEDLYEDWDTKKGEVLATLNNRVLNTPIREQLDYFKKELDSLILEVNQRIESGKNKDVKIKNSKLKEDKNNKNKKAKKWTLSYPTKDSEINNPFYDQFSRVSLNQVLRFVNQHSHFMDAFTHVKSRYSKTKADEDSIFACITANATNYGIFQMSTISDISYDKLFSTSKNFIRLETLKKGNDILANSISTLPIFKQWDLLDNLLVSSLDGKKIHVRLNHIMARYSSKYFGQKRGVVSYSMIVNNFCTNSKPISPNDHESHHFYDLASHNTSNIQPNWHCGDTHSINHVNFALFHLIGQRFTPHIKNISKKACSIHSFKGPSYYEKYLIVPDGKINENLLEGEWDNAQHIFASLLMNHTTQSVVVRKLSSHERGSKTQKALWEYDKILMSLHTLQFIDDPRYRQIIRTALNRGEGYHQLTGKLGSVNGGKFRGTTELELAIWNECTRFIANCIIYYNALILSKIYEAQENLGNIEVLEFIKRLSPIAWRHIILNGRYEFTTIPVDIDLDKMIALLVFDLKKNKART